MSSDKVVLMWYKVNYGPKRLTTFTFGPEHDSQIVDIMVMYNNMEARYHIQAGRGVVNFMTMASFVRMFGPNSRTEQPTKTALMYVAKWKAFYLFVASRRMFDRHLRHVLANTLIRICKDELQLP